MPTKNPKRPTLPEPDIVLRRGKPVSVILPIGEYEKLLNKAGEAADIAFLSRARRKARPFRSLDDYLAERRRA